MVLGDFVFLASKVLLVLFEVGLDVPEFAEQLVVLQNLEILNMVVRLVVSLELLFRLSWVDAFENT